MTELRRRRRDRQRSCRRARRGGPELEVLLLSLLIGLAAGGARVRDSGLVGVDTTVRLVARRARGDRLRGLRTHHLSSRVRARGDRVLRVRGAVGDRAGVPRSGSGDRRAARRQCARARRACDARRSTSCSSTSRCSPWSSSSSYIILRTTLELIGDRRSPTSSSPRSSRSPMSSLLGSVLVSVADLAVRRRHAPAHHERVPSRVVAVHRQLRRWPAWCWRSHLISPALDVARRRTRRCDVVPDPAIRRGQPATP